MILTPTGNARMAFDLTMFYVIASIYAEVLEMRNDRKGGN